MLYAAMCASSFPSIATPARGAATREAGSPRPVSKLCKDFHLVADCQPTPSLRPNAHTEVRLNDIIDVGAILVSTDRVALSPPSSFEGAECNRAVKPQHACLVALQVKFPSEIEVLTVLPRGGWPGVNFTARS